MCEEARPPEAAVKTREARLIRASLSLHVVTVASIAPHGCFKTRAPTHTRRRLAAMAEQGNAAMNLRNKRDVPDPVLRQPMLQAAIKAKIGQHMELVRERSVSRNTGRCGLGANGVSR